MSEGLGQVRYYEVRRPKNTVGTIVAGLVLGIMAYEAPSIIDRTRTDESTVEVPVDSFAQLTTEQRIEQYGKQVLFVCVIPGPDGKPRQVELNIGGPETPIEAARLLDPADAWSLLALGVAEYNEITDGPDMRLSMIDDSNTEGVVFDDLSGLSTTQRWGVKAMTVEVFKDQNGL